MYSMDRLDTIPASLPITAPNTASKPVSASLASTSAAIIPHAWALGRRMGLAVIAVGAIALLAVPDPAAARTPALADGRFGRQVRELKHQVSARVHGVLAETTVTVSLRSRTAGAEEGILTFRTPPRAVVTDLAVRLKGRWVSGALLNAKAVRRTVEKVERLPKAAQRADPAWLEQTGPNRYRLRVYPVPAQGSLRVRYRYVHPVTLRWGQRVYVYPRRGRGGNLARATVTIEDRSPFRSGRRRYRLRVPAKSTLQRPLSDPPIPTSQPLRLALFAAPPASGPERTARNRARKSDRRARQSGRRARRARNTPAGGVGRALVLLQGNPRAARRRWGSDVVLLVDDSRSMWRHHRDTAAAVLRAVTAQLGKQTRFGLVSFADRAKRVARLRPATAGRVKAALRRHRRLALKNGTSLKQGLRKAYALLGKGRTARRRLVVVLTDGLLPEREHAHAVWPDAPPGTELLILVGRPSSGVTRRLREGPLHRLARRQGGLAFGFDPRRHEDGSARGDKASHQAAGNLAASLARAGRLTNLKLKVDGRRVSLPHPDLTLVGGHLVVHRTPAGTARRASLRFGWWGKRRQQQVTARPLPQRWRRHLRRVLSGEDGADGTAGVDDRDGADGTDARGEADARGVSPARSLVVIHPDNAFGRDRLRFAKRWGGRFFRRMAPVGALDLAVGPFHVDRVSPHAPPDKSTREAPGRLTKSIVAGMIKKFYLKRATRCYQATGPKFKKGRAVLYMDLTRGEVADAWIDHSTMSDPKLHRCLVAAAKSLRVARSWSDQTLYRVSYPMRFRPANRSVARLRGWRPPARRAAPNPLRGLRGAPN